MLQRVFAILATLIASAALAREGSIDGRVVIAGWCRQPPQQAAANLSGSKLPHSW